MGKSAPKAPAPPDPAKTAALEGAQNKETAIAQGWLGAVNTNTPYGTVKYSAGNPVAGSGTYNTAGYQNALNQYNAAIKAAIAAAGKDNAMIADIKKNNAAPLLSEFYTKPQTQFTQNVKLDPSQQRQLNATNALQEQSLGGAGTLLTNAQNAIAQPFSYDGLPSQVGNIDGGDITSSVDTSGLPQTQSDVGYGDIQQSLNTSGLPDYTTSADGGDLARNIDASGVPSLMTNFDQARQQATNSIVDRNQPMMDRQRAALENRLANQGITQGSEAYRNAMDDLGRQENDFRLGAIQQGDQLQNQLFGQSATANQQLFGQAATQGQFGNQAQQQAYAQELANAGLSNDAINNLFSREMQSAQFGNQAQEQGFGQESYNAELANQLQQQLFNQNATQAQLQNQAQNQTFSQDQSNAALQNQARQQGIQERSFLRSQPINEFATLFGLGGQVQGPQFQNYQTPQLQNTDIGGLIQNQYQGQLNNYNNKVATRNANMQALGSAAGAAAGFGGGSGSMFGFNLWNK